MSAGATNAAAWNSTNLVTGVNLKRDAKGHVVGVTVDSIKMTSNTDTDTTYTLDYGFGTGSVPSTEIGSVERAGYVLHLTGVNVPENATEVTVVYSTDILNNLEVISWSSDSIDVVVNELPNPVAIFNIQYINNGLPLDGESTEYITASNDHKKLFNVEGITIPTNATEVSCDYEGLMGVPITFLHRFNPSQFEIVKFRKGDDGKDLRIDGKPTYFRILIKRVMS